MESQERYTGSQGGLGEFDRVLGCQGVSAVFIEVSGNFNGFHGFSEAFQAISGGFIVISGIWERP